MIQKSISILVVLLLLFTGLLQAQTHPEQNAAGKPLPLNPDVVHGKLANGLTYYIQHNEQPKDRATLKLVIKAGSILETEAQRGLAHFVEHMAFNGTKNFKKNELINFLERSGIRFGAHINAYTSFDETVYKLSLPTDSADIFLKGFQVLEDWAHNISFDPGEIDKERGVIVEERRLRLGARQRIQEKTMPKLFYNSHYPNRLPIGTLDVIKNFNHSQLTSFYNNWYRPELMAVVAVGDFDVSQVKEQIEKRFSSIKPGPHPKERKIYSIPFHKKTVTAVVTDKEVASTQFEIYYKKPHLVVDTEKKYVEKLKRLLYNRMMNARIREILLRPETPFLNAESSMTYLLGNMDAYKISVVPKEDRLMEALNAILQENIRVQKFGFTPGELERTKAALLNDYKNAFNERTNHDNAFLADEYINHFLNGEAVPGITFEYHFIRDHLNDITLNDMNRVAGELITEDNRVLILTAPENKKMGLPTEDELLEVVNKSLQMKATPYKDTATEQPLFNKTLKPAKIVSEEKLDSIGVTKLVLSNGANVFLKSTDFRNNQVLFRAVSPGGSSLYSNEDYLEASNAAAILSRSGIANFTDEVLKKMLSGQSVSVSPYISRFNEGLKGASSPDDLETLLKLAHLYFTSPRFDKGILQSWQDFQQNYIKNKYKSPNVVYEDTLRNIMNNYAERYAPLEVSDIDGFDFKRMQEIYLDRFEDADDFGFFFVGNFDIETIRPLIATYLGNLPTKKREENWKNLGIHPPENPVDKAVYQGTEPKSQVNLIFTGETTYDGKVDLQLNTASEILRIRLRETLREEEGGVYGISVRAGMFRIPEDRYSVQISFGCAPGNVDKLIEMIYDEIDNIKKNGPLKEDLDKVLAIKRREREVSLEQNEYWINLLTDSYLLNEKPEQIFNSYESELNTLTISNIRRTVDRYFIEKTVKKIVLYPQEQSTRIE